MAYTQTDLDALDAAVASGALRVKYSDKDVTFRSLTDLLRVRDIVAESVDGATGVRQVGIRLDRGL